MSKDNNALAKRRDEYIEKLNEAYISKYGRWLATQTAAKQERIKVGANNLKHGLAMAAPLVCRGPKGCPFFHACPIPLETNNPGPDSEYPIGISCPLEAEFVAQKIVDYIGSLKVDPSDPVEMALIQELALLDNYRNRAALLLAGGDLKGGGRDLLTTEDVVTTWDAEGNPNIIQNLRIHPAVEVMDKHEKRRSKILDQFAATRSSKFRVYGGNIETNSKLQEDLNQIRLALEKIGKGGFVLTSEESMPVLLDSSIKSSLLIEEDNEATEEA